MALKHAPATPLPWQANGAAIDTLADNVAPVATIEHLGLARNRDAAYIAHAANAYPKLVALTQRVAEWNSGNAVGAAADELLRALGEDA